MKKKLVSLLLISAVLCSLFVGCDEDDDPTGTTGDDVTQVTTELTDPIITTETDATIPGGQVITYTEYQEMNGEQQKNVISKFESKEQFDNWYEEIKEDHKDYMETVKPTDIVTPNSSTETTEFIEATTPNVAVPPEYANLTYMDLYRMTAEEQMEIMNSFASIDDFTTWVHKLIDEQAGNRKPIDGSTIQIGETTENGD